MTDLVEWIAAEAEKPIGSGSISSVEARRLHDSRRDAGATLRARGDEGSQNPHPSASSGQASWQDRPEEGQLQGQDQYPEVSEDQNSGWEGDDEERKRRIYRKRTVAMLRRYMRYSIETGRLPSLLGREFFRAKVTSYTVVTFEDRVIFVHDMETCLEKLDEFSRQLIGRHILQEHDRWATARLLNCNEKTIRRLTPLVLDSLSEILLDVGLMERIESDPKPCQEGEEGENFVSDCEHGKNKF